MLQSRGYQFCVINKSIPQQHSTQGDQLLLVHTVAVESSKSSVACATGRAGWDGGALRGICKRGTTGQQAAVGTSISSPALASGALADTTVQASLLSRGQKNKGFCFALARRAFSSISPNWCTLNTSSLFIRVVLPSGSSRIKVGRSVARWSG